MDKLYKSVPEAECLQYHGTPEKPDIKIFVSHRIDQDSVIVDNPLYIPIRCGATFDKREGVTMLGDDTGENISGKRESYSELTVQYWAWKNIEADYYGLCHYRRYLNFTGREYPGPWQRQGFIPSMSTANMKQCGLLDEEKMQTIIGSYDMVVPVEFDVSEVGTIHGSGFNTVYDYYCKGWENYFLTEDSMKILIDVVEEKYPEYSKDFSTYLKGKWFRGFNCFVMKSDLFKEMSAFEFTIMEEVEKLIDTRYDSEYRRRTIGYLIEVLFSLWIYHQQKRKKYTIKEMQILVFQDASVETPIKKERNGVPIVFTCVREEIPLLAVCIKSILENADENRFVDFIILLRNESWDRLEIREGKRRREMLQEICKGYPNTSLRFYDPKEEIGPVRFYKFGEINNEHQFYRIFLPWILPGYSKVIALKAPMIALGDITTMYDISLADAWAAASGDPILQGLAWGFSESVREHIKKDLHRNNINHFVNTEVTLINLEAVRNEASYDHWVGFCKTHKKYSESDLFNTLYEDHIIEMDMKYNYPVAADGCLYQAMELAPIELMAKYKKVKEPVVVNFPTMPVMPWTYPDCEFGPDFWYYARKTAFYEILLSIMLSMRITPLTPPPSFDSRSGVRKLVDRFFPYGTRRREVLKRMFPRGSLQRKALRRLYGIIVPKYRIPKEADKNKQEDELKDDKYGKDESYEIEDNEN